MEHSCALSDQNRNSSWIRKASLKPDVSPKFRLGTAEGCANSMVCPALEGIQKIVIVFNNVKAGIIISD
jgi:hypothetical protein